MHPISAIGQTKEQQSTTLLEERSEITAGTTAAPNNVSSSSTIRILGKILIKPQLSPIQL